MNVKTFTSPEGYEILVGQDDKSNDRLSLKEAAQNDLWFHVSGFPGSHVVLKSGNSKPSKESIETAAKLAAWYSKMRAGGRVTVSYCLAKYVSKPRGAKPGTVNIKNEKNIKVKPGLPDTNE